MLTNDAILQIELHKPRIPRIFYCSLIAWIAIMYVWLVFDLVGDSLLNKSTTRFVFFTILLIFHTALHWYSQYLKKLRSVGIYLVIQAAFIVVLSLLSGNGAVTFVLYLSSISEIFALLNLTRLTFLSVFAYLGLFSVNFVAVWGLKDLLPALAAILPLVAFISGYIVLFVRQEQARKRAQILVHELEATQAQIAMYAEQVQVLTLATERQRLARELHDTLAQGLSGVILQLEAVNSHLSNGRIDRAQVILQQSLSRARASMADARRAINALRTEMITSDDLIAALQEEINRFTEATGIPCHSTINLPPMPSTSTYEHALRAVVEGLSNVARHAQAQQVWLQVINHNNMLTIHIKDDGIGFDTERAVGQTHHYGLLGMRERARLTKGSLEVVSKPGNGTSVRLQLPLSSES